MPRSGDEYSYNPAHDRRAREHTADDRGRRVPARRDEDLRDRLRDRSEPGRAPQEPPRARAQRPLHASRRRPLAEEDPVLCFGTIFERNLDRPVLHGGRRCGRGASDPAGRVRRELAHRRTRLAATGKAEPGHAGRRDDRPGTAGATASAGDTWACLRLKLPFNLERDGTWEVRVTPDSDWARRAGRGRAPAQERFFITTVIDGGQFLRPLPVGRPYTGDTISQRSTRRLGRRRVAATRSDRGRHRRDEHLLARSGLGGRDVDGGRLGPRTTLVELGTNGRFAHPTSPKRSSYSTTVSTTTAPPGRQDLRERAARRHALRGELQLSRPGDLRHRLPRLTQASWWCTSPLESTQAGRVTTLGRAAPGRAPAVQIKLTPTSAAATTSAPGAQTPRRPRPAGREPIVVLAAMNRRSYAGRCLGSRAGFLPGVVSKPTWAAPVVSRGAACRTCLLSWKLLIILVVLLAFALVRSTRLRLMGGHDPPPMPH